MSTPLCLPKGMVVVTRRSKSSVSMVTSYNKALVSQLVTPIFEILMSDHYAALGLASSATLADVKKAYRQKAAFYHPDRNDAEDAAERFRAVQAAYDVLSDDDKRQAYDDNRRRNLLDNPLDTAREIWQSYFKTIQL